MEMFSFFLFISWGSFVVRAVLVGFGGALVMVVGFILGLVVAGFVVVVVDLVVGYLVVAVVGVLDEGRVTEDGGDGGEGFGTDIGKCSEALRVGDVPGASLYTWASRLRIFVGLVVSLDLGLEGLWKISVVVIFGIVSLFERRRQRDSPGGETG